MMADAYRNCKPNIIYFKETKQRNPTNQFLESLDFNRQMKFIIRSVRRAFWGWEGPNRSEDRMELQKEIEDIRSQYNKPWIIGGNFNIILYGHERLGGDTNHGDREAFNNTIAELGLIEITITDRRFTWSNMRENPSLAKLDRVLVSTE